MAFNSSTANTFVLVDFQPLDPKHHGDADAAIFSTGRYNQMEKFIKESIAQDRDYFQGEKKTLDKIIKTLGEQVEQLSIRKKDTLTVKQQVIEEKGTCQNELQTALAYKPESTEEELNEKIRQLKQTILNLSKKRQDDASKIACDHLKKIEIKNKDKESEVNELWIWTMVVLYKESANFYDWSNFRDQVFGNAESGNDFKERLAKVKAVDLKKDEVERTQKLLKSKEKIMQSPLLVGQIRENVKAVFDIIDLIMQIENSGAEVHKHEQGLRQMAVDKQKNLDDKQRLNEKLKILDERLDFLDLIFREYDLLEKELEKKIHSYKQAIELNDRFLDQMNQEYLNLDYTKSYNQTYVPPPVMTVQHQEIDEQALEQKLEAYENKQHQHQQEEKQAEGHVLTPQVGSEKPLEVQASNHFSATQQQQFQEPPQTEIRDVKTGGCDACNVF